MIFSLLMFLLMLLSDKFGDVSWKEGRSMVKKGLLVSACIAMLFASSAFAYDSQIVKGENFSYQFDIYSPEESILHELMHSFGVTSYAAGDKETIEVIGYIPYSVYDKNLRI